MPDALFGDANGAEIAGAVNVSRSGLGDYWPFCVNGQLASSNRDPLAAQVAVYDFRASPFGINAHFSTAHH